MKIGIITFHCAHNYGAVLQAYALQTHLISRGYDVKIVNYRPDYLVKPYEFTFFKVLSYSLFKDYKIRNLKSKIKSYNTWIPFHRKFNKFNNFINQKLNLSPIISNKEDIKDCDVYVIGSDQVWNLNMTQKDNIYWGYFDYNKPKVSYAASMGMDVLSSTEQEYISKALCNFKKISVRENKALQLLEGLTNSSIFRTLDPTFLLTKKQWEGLISKKHKRKEKYVLIYQIHHDEALIEYANKIAQEKGAMVIEIASIFKLTNHLLIKDAGPLDFLEYINASECVITSSFHGTAFSLIFEKELYIFPLKNEGLNERVRELYEFFSINLNTNPLFPYMASKVDYHSNKPKILNAIEQSKKILNDFLE